MTAGKTAMALVLVSLCFVASDGAHSQTRVSPSNSSSVIEQAFVRYLKDSKARAEGIKGFVKAIEENDPYANEPLQSFTGISPTVITIPKGRSLQRDKADFKSPRSVFAIPSKNSTIPSSYVGHASRAGQIEALSWNEKQGRYEFLIIENFGAGKTPKIKHADRDVCLTCHQHGGPIFSRFPWAEVVTTTDTAAATEHQKRLAKEKSAQQLTDIFAANSSPFTFDALVRTSARALASRRICEKFSRDTEFKKDLFRLVFLDDQPNFGGGGQVARSEKSNQVIKKLKELAASSEFSYPSSVLPDRNPFINEKNDGTAAFGISLSKKGNENSPTFSERTSAASVISPFQQDDTQMIQVPYQADTQNLAIPSNARPKVRLIEDDQSFSSDSAALLIAQSCFNSSLIELGALGLSQKEMNTANDQGIFSDLLEQPGFPNYFAIKDRLVNRGFLSSAEGRSNLLQFCRTNSTKPMSHQSIDQTVAVLRSKEANAISLTHEEKRAAASNFGKYCMQCHGKDGEIELGVDFANAKSILNYGTNDGNPGIALYRLRKHEMPPTSAQAQPTDEERALMVRWLEDEQKRLLKGKK